MIIKIKQFTHKRIMLKLYQYSRIVDNPQCTEKSYYRSNRKTTPCVCIPTYPVTLTIILAPTLEKEMLAQRPSTLVLMMINSCSYSTNDLIFNKFQIFDHDLGRCLASTKDSKSSFEASTY